MTDGAERSDVKARLGYSESRPARCCWNCACSFFPHDQTCSRLDAEYASTPQASPSRLSVAECGVCGRWVSKTVVAIYRDSSSLEEARLKSSVVSDGSCTDELDNAFCEEKATPNMTMYMMRICAEPEMAGKASPVPFDAWITDDGRLYFTPSKSFWLVRKWLEENAPAYEELVETRRSYASRTAEKNLKKFMMRVKPRYN